MSQLVEFYRGTGEDAEGRKLADVWAFSDDEMESHHDFIYACFPGFLRYSCCNDFRITAKIPA